MTFTVTYRDPTGAKREEAIEAESREAAFAAARGHGIAPMMIREGGHARRDARIENGRLGIKNGRMIKGDKGKAIPQSHNSIFTHSHKPIILVSIGILVLLVLLGWLWWKIDNGNLRIDNEDCGRPGAPRTPQSQIDGTKKVVKAPNDLKSPKAVKGSRVSAEMPPVVPQPVVQTNVPATNNVVYIVPPIDPDDPDIALRSRTTQELGSILSVTPGEPIPPFPYAFILEDDAKEQGTTASNGNDIFLESLRKTKIQAKETDSDAVMKHKEALVTAQMDLLDGIKDGLSVNDTIRAAYEFRVRAYEYRTELISTLREFAGENPTREDFTKALKEVNAKLTENGIKTIPAEEVVPELEEDKE